MLKIEIKTSGLAYKYDNGELDPFNIELIRNLEEITENLKYGYSSGNVMDINGNKVGKWELTD